MQTQYTIQYTIHICLSSVLYVCRDLLHHICKQIKTYYCVQMSRLVNLYLIILKLSAKFLHYYRQYRHMKAVKNSFLSDPEVAVNGPKLLKGVNVREKGVVLKKLVTITIFRVHSIYFYSSSLPIYFLEATGQRNLIFEYFVIKMANILFLKSYLW